MSKGEKMAQWFWYKIKVKSSLNNNESIDIPYLNKLLLNCDYDIPFELKLKDGLLIVDKKYQHWREPIYIDEILDLLKNYGVGIKITLQRCDIKTSKESRKKYNTNYKHYLK